MLNTELDNTRVIGDSSGTFAIMLLKYRDSLVVVQLSPKAGNCESASLEGENENGLFVTDEPERHDM